MPAFSRMTKSPGAEEDGQDERGLPVAAQKFGHSNPNRCSPPPSQTKRVLGFFFSFRCLHLNLNLRHHITSLFLER